MLYTQSNFLIADYHRIATSVNGSPFPFHRNVQSDGDHEYSTTTVGMVASGGVFVVGVIGWWICSEKKEDYHQQQTQDEIRTLTTRMKKAQGADGVFKTPRISRAQLRDDMCCLPRPLILFSCRLNLELLNNYKGNWKAR